MNDEPALQDIACTLLDMMDECAISPNELSNALDCYCDWCLLSGYADLQDVLFYPDGTPILPNQVRRYVEEEDRKYREVTERDLFNDEATSKREHRKTQLPHLADLSDNQERNV